MMSATQPEQQEGTRNVLIVEDDDAIRRGVRDSLRLAGFRTWEASDGVLGLEAALELDLDLLLLDVLLPRRDGFSILEDVRHSKPGLPIILLTARGAEEDRVRGLRRGADDYVVKPFSMSELVARVEAVLRRSPDRPLQRRSIEIGGRSIDFDRREASLSNGELVNLTPRESRVLHFLASNAGRTVSREELLRSVWSIDPRGVETRAVDMLVARLREKLDDGTRELIVTVRSRGYMLAVGA